MIGSPSWIQEPNDVDVIEGEKASFICAAVGYPNPKITWKKLGK